MNRQVLAVYGGRYNKKEKGIRRGVWDVSAPWDWAGMFEGNKISAAEGKMNMTVIRVS